MSYTNHVTRVAKSNKSLVCDSDKKNIHVKRVGSIYYCETDIT